MLIEKELNQHRKRCKIFSSEFVHLWDDSASGLARSIANSNKVFLQREEKKTAEMVEKNFWKLEKKDQLKTRSDFLK